MNGHIAPEAIAIARLIHAQMTIKGVTQAQLSAEMGISQSYLSRRLKGQGALDLNQIFTACAFLGIDPQETLVLGIRMANGADVDNFSIIDAVSD